MLKIAFVTPWYGADIPGGAEALTRSTAEHLVNAGFPVEVLTTTIEQFHSDWSKNGHRPGSSLVNGVPVRRFPVKARDAAQFDQINWRLLQGLPVTAEEEQSFVEEMFRAPDLYNYIAANQDDHLFFFVVYMFASTYFGVQVTPQHSVIIPCLHDESYAHLPVFQNMLQSAAALIFNSAGEATLAERLLNPVEGQIREVIGMGIDLEISGNPRRFREKYRIDGPFVLYVGRREPGKNTPLLVDYWRQYVQQTGRTAKLVLIGPGEVVVPPTMQDLVVDLGFVSEQDKQDAHAAAALLCQPSLHESFSIVLLESWRAGVPVLVHGNCAVTRSHCQLSNGGLYFQNYEEFAATVSYFLDHPEVAVQMGRQGQLYVKQQFQWDIVIDKYRNLIERLTEQNEASREGSKQL